MELKVFCFKKRLKLKDGRDIPRIPQISLKRMEKAFELLKDRNFSLKPGFALVILSTVHPSFATKPVCGIHKTSPLQIVMSLNQAVADHHDLGKPRQAWVFPEAGVASERKFSITRELLKRRAQFSLNNYSDLTGKPSVWNDNSSLTALVANRGKTTTYLEERRQYDQFPFWRI